MKIVEAINILDSIKQNTFTKSDKIRWLSTLDAAVKLMMDQYDGGNKINFKGYTDDTDEETVLLVPAPYDDVYLRWMEAQIDYANGEYGKYNNAVAMFNAAFDEFAKYYARSNTPLNSGRRFIF